MLASARRGRVRTRGRSAGVALLALLAGACTSAGAHVYNLEQLHTDDGHHRFSAVQMGGFEYEFRSGMRTLLPKSAVAMQQKEPRAIDDPLELCLENLVDLQGVSSQDPHDASLKVQCFARWAVEDPWQLSRERCLLINDRPHLWEELAPEPPAVRDRAAAGPATSALVPAASVVKTGPQPVPRLRYNCTPVELSPTTRLPLTSNPRTVTVTGSPAVWVETSVSTS